MHHIKKKLYFLYLFFLILTYVHPNHLFAKMENEKKEINPFDMAQFVLKINDTSTSNFRSVGFEKPIYGHYISYGFELDLFNTSVFSTCDAGFVLKFTSPSLSFSGSNIALTLSSFGGIGRLLFINGDRNSRIAGVASASVGVEFFPIIWLGISVEYQNRYYWSKLSSKKIISSQDLVAFNPSFSNLLTFSVRTTW